MCSETAPGMATGRHTQWGYRGCPRSPGVCPSTACSPAGKGWGPPPGPTTRRSIAGILCSHPLLAWLPGIRASPAGRPGSPCISVCRLEVWGFPSLNQSALSRTSWRTTCTFAPVLPGLPLAPRGQPQPHPPSNRGLRLALRCSTKQQNAASRTGQGT